MSGRSFVSYHRQGTAGGFTYTARVAPAAGGGWGWGGYQGSGANDPGAELASGGPFQTREEAAAFADEWFYSIEDIVETAGHRPAPTITTDDLPSASGIAGKKRSNKKSKRSKR